MSQPSGTLVARTLRTAALGGESREAMWGVFSRFYAEVTRDKFERDLAQKDHVILLSDSGDGSIQGFSTLQVYDRTLRGRRFIAIFSGDTIVTPDYWGQSALQKAFFRFIMRTKLQNPLTPVYWFLISKGYKTYLLLSRNFVEYYPRHDRPTPAWEAELIELLARDKYGDAFRPELGVLQFEECEGRLRSGVVPIEAKDLEHADIRFFVERNPGHGKGDELCCIGRIDAALWVSFTAKLARRATAGLAREMLKPWTASS
jgi:hypothetical protein